jgi:hypothetical protein
MAATIIRTASENLPITGKEVVTTKIAMKLHLLPSFPFQALNNESKGREIAERADNSSIHSK